MRFHGEGATVGDGLADADFTYLILERLPEVSIGRHTTRYISPLNPSSLGVILAFTKGKKFPLSGAGQRVSLPCNHSASSASSSPIVHECSFVLVAINILAPLSFMNSIRVRQLCACGRPDLPVCSDKRGFLESREMSQGEDAETQAFCDPAIRGTISCDLIPSRRSRQWRWQRIL